MKYYLVIDVNSYDEDGNTSNHYHSTAFISESLQFLIDLGSSIYQMLSVFFYSKREEK